MRVLYELWKLCTAISPANAILMYASRINVGASDETFRRVSIFLFEYTSLFVTRYEFGIHFRVFPSFVFLLSFSLFFLFHGRIREFTISWTRLDFIIVSLIVGENRVSRWKRAQAK